MTDGERPPRGGEWTYAHQVASGRRPFTVRFRTDLVEALDRAREASGLSRTEYLSQLFEGHLATRRALDARPADAPRVPRRRRPRAA